jgi:hypothetical protein
MISFKVSVAINHTLELKAKVKVDTDTNENCLPFEDLVIETMPTNAETPEIRLRIINNTQKPNNSIESQSAPASAITKKSWWKRWF